MDRCRVLFAGRCTLDVVYVLDELPAEDTKAFAQAFHAAPGGPATNAAVTHALLGGEALLTAAVGRGPWADTVRGVLSGHGVKLLDMAEGTGYALPLTTVLTSLPHATRTIVNPPRTQVALAPLPGVWSEAVPADWGTVPPDIALTDGFQLAETLPLLSACRAQGTALCLDGGSWKPGTAELAPLLTTAVCGERFRLPGQGLEAPNAAEQVTSWFAAQGVPQIAVTRGARPILGWERGRRFEVEIEPVACAETLGAGDVLHGALCYFLARGLDFEVALRRAAELATASCRSPGIEGWREGA